MTRSQTAELLYLLVPGDMNYPLAVAGGYAAAPQLAEDVDLWVLNVKRENFDRTETDIRRHLIRKGFLKPTAPVCYGQFTPYDNHPGQFKVIAEVTPERDTWGVAQRIQIILTEMKFLGSLLQRFDITTHMTGWFLNKPDQNIVTSQWTPVYLQPRVVDFTRARHTLGRITKLAKRYGFTPNIHDIARLNDSITIQEWSELPEGVAR